MNKVLLASGCSWTDENFQSIDTSLDASCRGPWPMWPQIFAESVDAKCVNLGKSGKSNKYIFDSIVNKLYSGEQIDYVVVIWTSWDRFEYMGIETHYPILSLLIDCDEEISSFKDQFDGKNIKSYTDIFKDMSQRQLVEYAKDVIDTNLRYMTMLSSLLEERNIPYLFFQGISAFPIHISCDIDDMESFTDSSMIKQMHSSVYHNKINKNPKIIGFPFFKIFGGYKIADDLTASERISYNDPHPNKNGQIKIAKIISNCWKEIYN